MKKERSVLIVAGTTEGRKLAEYVSESMKNKRSFRNWSWYVSTATEYGKSILEEEELKEIKLISGRMDEQEIESFLEKHSVEYVIDATHPFAKVVTENLRRACEQQNISYVRCLRERSESSIQNENRTGEAERSVVCTESIDEAVEFLKGTQGNILITTGSKELGTYRSLPNYKERCYARVLSTQKAVEDSVSYGFSGKHLIAMQGPFSVEMNLALLHQTNAAYFVTKESGTAGGFEEKVLAARQAGAVLVVIGRPQEEGMSVEETCRYLEKIL